MKKLISILLSLMVFQFVYSQTNLDTVRVRNLKQRGRDYIWCLGQIAGTKDSSTLYWIDKIGAAVKSQIPNISQQNWNNDVTIDSLPGVVVLFFYNKYQGSSGGVQREVGNTIYTSIRAVPQLQYFIGASDANFSKEYIEDIKAGKAAGYDN